MTSAEPTVRLIKEGDMVTNTRSGRIGMLICFNHRTNRCTVQFGASGPSEEFSASIVQRATAKEIVDAGLVGVGCNQQDEVDEYLRSRGWKHR